MEAGGRAIRQPDVSHEGGITEGYKIAGMAEAYDLALAPHCPLRPLALSACPQTYFVSLPAVSQEQTNGLRYTTGAGLLDFAKTNQDSRLDARIL